MSLSSCVVDDNADTTERHFTANDLRELFTFNEGTLSNTHDTFKCKRCSNGKQLKKAPALLYGDTSSSVVLLVFAHSLLRALLTRLALGLHPTGGITSETRISKAFTTIC